MRNRRLFLVERALTVNDFPSALWARSHGVHRRMDLFLWGKYELSSAGSLRLPGLLFLFPLRRMGDMLGVMHGQR